MAKSNKSREGVTSADPVREVEAKMTALDNLTKGVLDWKRVTRLESSAEYERCGSVLVAIKEQINEAEKERKLIVDPLNGVVKHVNQKVKVYTGPRQDLEAHCKFLMKTYLEEQRAIVAKAAEKEAKAAEKKGATQLAEDIRERALATLPVPANAAVSYRDHWTFKIVDFSKVPREFLCVDEAKVKKLAGENAPKVPGIEFYKDTIVAVSA